MTQDRDFKRRVRARMRDTGEPYTVARAHLLRHPPPARWRERARRWLGTPLRRRRGGPGMYPFDRFTEGAKKVLTWSQDEARDAGHRYIGTEHLALAVCRDRSDLAGVVLRRMGVHPAEVRQLRERLQAARSGGPLERLLPSARLKSVIEIALDESRRMGQPVVATEHLLLGLLSDGGEGAQALQGLGVTLDRTRELVRAHTGWTLPDHYGEDLKQVLFAAGRLAEREEHTEVTLDHLRRALAEAPGDDPGAPPPS